MNHNEGESFSLLPAQEAFPRPIRRNVKERLKNMMEALLYAEIYLICMIVVGLLLHWSVRSESRSASDQWLIRCYAGFLATFTANFLFTVFNRGIIQTPWTKEISYLLKTFFFLLFSNSVMCWCGYAETEIRQGDMVRKKVHLMFIVPSLLSMVPILLNLWNHQFFQIDDSLRYVRGPYYHLLMLSLFAFTAFFAVRLVHRSFREFGPNRKAHMLVTASFSLCILLAWVFSFAGESVPVICVCVMLNLLCIYTGTNRQQISMDKLTQVNNRQNLIGFINYKLINHESRLYALMIDVDYFKPINDTYGHLEGDHALMRVANALKHSCNSFKRRPFIARYGGDEFIIVLEGTQEDADMLCSKIRQHLQESQEKENAPYDLTVSIGVAGYRSGMQSKDLIAAADEELYKIKQARDKNKSPNGHH